MPELNTKQIIKMVIPLLIALLSILVFSKTATSTQFHQKTLSSLDEKKATVMELAAASAATSTAITLLPGDAATPIAEKLADLSSYFLVVLCAIYLEKFLVTLTGYVAFSWMIPIACILFSVNTFWKKDSIKLVVEKMVIFSIAIVLLIPVSVKVSNLIEDTYGTSIDQTIESAKQSTEEVEKEAAASDASDEEENTDEDSTKEESGFFSGLFSKVEEGVSNTTAKFENVLNHFIEAIAVLMVTSCVIPIVVLLFFVWITKMILGVDIRMPKRIKK